MCLVEHVFECSVKSSLRNAGDWQTASSRDNAQKYISAVHRCIQGCWLRSWNFLRYVSRLGGAASMSVTPLRRRLLTTLHPCLSSVFRLRWHLGPSTSAKPISRVVRCHAHWELFLSHLHRHDAAVFWKGNFTNCVGIQRKHSTCPSKMLPIICSQSAARSKISACC